jgi:hypothetical protein
MNTEYCGEVAAKDRQRVRDILDSVHFERLSDYGMTMRRLNDLIEEIRLQAEVAR